MITDLATGSAPIPDSQPGETVDVVVAFDRPMPNTDYDVSVLRSIWMPDVEVVVELKEKHQVTLTVKSPAGKAGSSMLHVICTRHTGPDSSTPPTKKP